jgi:hypothetical protein
MTQKIALFVSLFILIAAAGCATRNESPQACHRHVLAGCWQAKEDPTILIFRDDGTFIGQDFKKQRIFGTWIVLNKSQIGFQSLYYSGFYNPQYAEVTATGMRYAYTPRNPGGSGPGFAHCVRMDFETAMKEINLSSLNETSE